jgi:uncharacterized protein YxeA
MARVLGLGTLNKVDDDDSGSVYTTMNLMVDVTSPPRRRVRVDDTALEDTLSTDSMGIEDKSDYEFTYFRDTGATPHSIIKTLFDAKTQVLWQITHSDNGTETFEGVVAEQIPQPIKHNEHQLEKVVVHRKTAITYA